MITGPNIVTDGLVFGYDADDRSTRFYPGEPTTNIIKLLQNLGSTCTTSYGTSLYQVTALESKVQNSEVYGGQYSRFIGNGTDGNSQVFWTSASAYNAKSKQITISAWLKGSGTCHLTLYDDVSGYGTSSTINLTSSWTRYTYTRTVGNYTASWWGGIRGIINTTNVYVSGVLLEQKSHTTQFTQTTRSVTESLIDLKRNTTIDVSNLSFDSTAHPVFNGTDSLIYFGTNNIFNINSNVTVETVCLPNSANLGNIFSASANDGYRIRIENDRQFWLYSAGNTIKGGDLTLGTYHHCVAVFSSTGLRAYINGVLVASNNIPYSPNNNWPYTFIGTANGVAEFFDGKIPILKIYNRALTSQDVQQNYNAYEKRFNI